MQHDFRQAVEQVKLRSPLDVIAAERGLELRRRGSRLWARCPFHEEKTPSFALDPERGTWYCFGACGEGGDVLTFVERFDGLSFHDALELLAQRAGVELPRGRRAHAAEEEGEAERLHDVLARAARFYARTLRAPEGARALAYARGRGLAEATIEGFGLGWAPERGNPLLDAARSRSVPERVLEGAGLVRRSDDGRPYDFFRGRLVIPIHDRLGRVVGFGGRLLPGDERQAGKYVNTPETALFKKSRLVYALHLAAPEVRRTRRALLVEGYTDVMAAHQAGFANAVAVLGTSTTLDHAQLVRQSGARRATCLFDGDPAGREAALRAVGGLLAAGLEVDVVTLPAGLDPADLLAEEGGSERLAALLAAPADWLAFALEGLAGLPPAALAEGVDRVLPLLEKLARPVERDARLAEMARVLGVPEAGLRAQAEAARRRRGAAPAAGGARSAAPGPDAPLPGGRVPSQGGRAARTPAERALGLLVGAALLDNGLLSLLEGVVDEVPPGEVQEVARTVLELAEGGSEEARIDADAVLSALGNRPARSLVVPMVELARRAESPKALARDQLAWFERRARERSTRTLLTRLHSAPAVRPAPLDEGTRAVLRGLHAELRRMKVPTRRTPAPPDRQAP